MPIARRAVLAAPALLAAGRTAAQNAAPPAIVPRCIVPFPPGGGADVVVRLLAPGLGAALGGPVVVDNRPGGGTVIGTDAAAKAPADGGTLLLVANSFTINATLLRAPPFDARRDFTGVAMLGVNQHVLVAAPDFPPDTLAAVIAAARAAPGGLTYASFGNGTSGHLGGEALARAAGIPMMHVPYRGAGPALTDVMGGRVQLMLSNLPDALPLLAERRIKGIAISGAARHPRLPDVPTFAEAGLPGFVSDSWFALVARSGTPAAALDRLTGAINALLRGPDLPARYAAVGIDARPMERAAFDAFLVAEFERTARIIGAAGITAD